MLSTGLKKATKSDSIPVSSCDRGSILSAPIRDSGSFCAALGSKIKQWRKQPTPCDRSEPFGPGNGVSSTMRRFSVQLMGTAFHCQWCWQFPRHGRINRFAEARSLELWSYRRTCSSSKQKNSGCALGAGLHRKESPRPENEEKACDSMPFHLRVVLRALESD